MNAIDILKKEFSKQDFEKGQPYAEMLDRYKDIACNYARMENAIAVLSDLRTNTSYIYYGGFSQTLGIDKSGKENKVSSIWEEEVFKLIHLMIWQANTCKSYLFPILSSVNIKGNVLIII